MSGTAHAQFPHDEINAAHMTGDARDIQPFWLGRQRVYAEFSSPEDEDEGDAYESGCFCTKRSSMEILIFDHATKSLQISTGLGKVDSRSNSLEYSKLTIN
jgi:hypothetical protein